MDGVVVDDIAQNAYHVRALPGNVLERLPVLGSDGAAVHMKVGKQGKARVFQRVGQRGNGHRDGFDLQRCRFQKRLSSRKMAYSTTSTYFPLL